MPTGDEEFYQGWAGVIAEVKDTDARVSARVDELVAAHHERERMTAAIREVARQAGERAVELYLADLAEGEWMREKSPESLT